MHPGPGEPRRRARRPRWPTAPTRSSSTRSPTASPCAWRCSTCWPGARAEAERMNLLIRNGRVVDPANGMDAVQDVLIADGRIARVGPRPRGAGGRRDDRRRPARWSCPGFIDIHVHLREPGTSTRRRSRAARAPPRRAASPRSRCMANTHPGQRQPRGHRLHPGPGARSRASVRVYPIGAVTRRPRGQAARRAGRAGRGRLRGLLRRRQVRDERGALPPGAWSTPCPSARRSSATPRTATLAHGGVDARGLRLHRARASRASPAAAEDVMVARDIVLAELTGRPRAHRAHLDRGRGAARARRQGARRPRSPREVTPAPPAPHRRGGAQLRLQREDGAAAPRPSATSRRCLEALADGTIDCDRHRPRAARALREGGRVRPRPPTASSGSRRRSPLLLDRLVRPRRARPRRPWSRGSAAGPARLLNLPGGSLAPGAPGRRDDPRPRAEPGRSSPARFRSRGRNTPVRRAAPARGAPWMTAWCGGVVTGERVMSAEPVLLALARRPRLPRARRSAPRGESHGRGRLQHRHDRLPGDPHRSRRTAGRSSA